MGELLPIWFKLNARDDQPERSRPKCKNLCKTLEVLYNKMHYFVCSEKR